MSADPRHTPPIPIAPEHWAILRRHAPGSAVWAFGSRAAGNARCYSDLDLAVISDEPMSIDALATLTEAFADSDLPWTVDVVALEGLSERPRDGPR